MLSLVQNALPDLWLVLVECGLAFCLVTLPNHRLKMRGYFLHPLEVDGSIMLFPELPFSQMNLVLAFFRRQSGFPFIDKLSCCNKYPNLPHDLPYMI